MQDKKIIIIAGPNGAGKTTFAREFLPNEANCPIFINADLIFSRDDSDAEKMTEKQIERHVNKEIKKLKGSSISVDDLVKTQEKLKKATLVSAQIDIEDRDLLAQISDQIRDKLKSGVIVLLGKGSGTHPLLVTVTKDLTTSVKAGDILRDVAGAMGGKGGGRPDFAQGAVPNINAWKDAQSKLKEILS